MTSWHSYPKIYNLGHKALTSLFDGPFIIEEKIDGSQISFGIFDDDLRMRSKNREFAPDEADSLFAKAAESVKAVAHLLRDGYTYRGEYLAKPQHNALKYDRVPENHIIIFDVNTGEEEYADPHWKRAEADRIGFEYVTEFFINSEASKDALMSLLENESCLGGPKIEGVVIKNYTQFGPDKKALMGKHVSEAFKEVHRKTWGESNPSSKNILDTLADELRTEARWAKAVQHLREAGKITDTPADIPNILGEIQRDILVEEDDYITSKLRRWALPHIRRNVVKGAAEWYKERLLEKQFEEVAG